MLVKEMLNAYYAAKGPTQMAPHETLKCINFLTAFMGDMEVVGMENSVAEEYVAQRARGRVGWVCPKTGAQRGMSEAGHATVRRELIIFNAAKNWACRQRIGGKPLLRLDDAPVFNLPPDSPIKDLWLLREQAWAVLKAAQPAKAKTLRPAYVAIALGLFTASRRDAIAALVWDRVTLNTRAIKAGQEDDLGVIDYREPGRRITKKRRAIVPIMPELAPILLRAYEERDNQLVLGTRVWPRNSVEGAFKRAGVPWCTPHTLRHTWATWAAQDGVPLWQIAGILADTMQTVERRYAHHHPDYLVKAVKRRVFDDGASTQNKSRFVRPEV